MERPAHRFLPRCRAFTLVEVLLALALVGALLLAMNFFLLSMGELWGASRQQRLFDQHVRAVTRYLDDLMRRGVVAAAEDRALHVAAPALPAGGEPRLMFDLRDGDRLLPWPDAPLPNVECSLAVTPEGGLRLFWQSRWELDFGTVAPRAVVVSPLVTRLDYLYYRADARTWRTEASPASAGPGRWLLPDRLRLHFKYDRFTAETVVNLPVSTAALPAF